MTEALIGRPNYVESLSQNHISAVSLWLDQIDRLGEDNIDRQDLTERQLEHPLKWDERYWFGQHQINIQIAVLASELLNNEGYFTEEQRNVFLKRIQNITWGDGRPRWSDSDTSPWSAVNKLDLKQKGYLPKGESFQFAKVGLEVSSQSQRVAYKLHSLVELLEPYATPEANSYPDQLADIMTVAIMEKSDVYKQLATAIGPCRYSVRWVDFLDKGGNSKLNDWIGKSEELLPERQSFEDIRLDISWAESRITPGTIIQLLHKKTFRSTGDVPPLRPINVADPHSHSNKVEIYLPLMGPGGLKVETLDKRQHTHTPNLNLELNIDLMKLGALMEDGIPTLVYDGKKYQPEKGEHYINMPFEGGGFAQWVVVYPGEIHEFTNTGISPATAFALALGFPKEEGLPLKGDFIEASKDTFVH